MAIGNFAWTDELPWTDELEGDSDMDESPPPRKTKIEEAIEEATKLMRG